LELGLELMKFAPALQLILQLEPKAQELEIDQEIGLEMQRKLALFLQLQLGLDLGLCPGLETQLGLVRLGFGLILELEPELGPKLESKLLVKLGLDFWLKAFRTCGHRCRPLHFRNL